MEKAAAKQAVSELRKKAQPSFTESDETRAYTLINNPDELNQGFYGTCGMAAVVRSFLQHDRARFVELLNAIYLGTDFNGIATGQDVLLKGRQKQRTAKEEHQGTAYETQFDLDFVLTRSLGKLLKIHSPHMYEAQKLFSERIARLFNVKKEPFLDAFTLDPKHSATLNKGEIDDGLRFVLKIKGWRLGQIAGFTVDMAVTDIEVETVTPNDLWVLRFKTGSRDKTDRALRILRTDAGPLQVAVDVRASDLAFRDEGDLGLDSDGLKSLVHDVAGAPTATITRIDPSDARPAVDAVNTELAGAKPYVYALIRSFDDWSQAKWYPAKRTFPDRPTPPDPIWGRPEPEGEHIVAVNGTIRKEAGHYVVPVWTWATAFEVRVPEDQLAGYLPVLVHGRIG